ncbi:hypothetical protein [Deinococcus cellulosilyticus]|uniref:Uncharacterized protein n=1 Tax=Deinococcus cellulosilyticus (strain DSM 18568 / NBRC 106333 / KACC 11606 / 5516J-15) TaxID=1223518 RepID=A0A511MXJ5_DEIC1|nr:hypothetical protein [Deinococcus cellulosilyticus]GEM45304.1 hypothetical protein DC3_09390 [Deinococcus cellulosilyticus NBRC 106333 = KACC 11606]
MNVDLTPWIATVRELGSFALIIYFFVNGMTQVNNRLKGIETVQAETQKTQVQMVSILDRQTDALERMGRVATNGAV